VPGGVAYLLPGSAETSVRPSPLHFFRRVHDCGCGVDHFLASGSLGPLALTCSNVCDLTEDDQRVLGFGNKTNYVPAFERAPAYEGLQATFRFALYARMHARQFSARVRDKVKRTLSRNGE